MLYHISFADKRETMALASDLEPSLLQAELWEEDEEELSVPVMEDTEAHFVEDPSPVHSQ